LVDKFIGLLRKPTSVKDFDAIKISLASPEKIRSWSYGEVTKPETINYRTFKPERDGLFCAKIFGPINDWECLCGKYKRMKHRGVICDKCGVEVTQSKVRRERMGHIELASPVSHIWFFKGTPTKIGHLLGISVTDLERVLYFESYIILDPSDSGLDEKDVISDEKYRELRETHPKLRVGMGAEAIKELLAKSDVNKMAVELRELMNSTDSKQKKIKYAKQLKVVESFKRSGNRPDWMILDVIPVIPPELRPLVPLDGGRFASSDLNDLYRRVINRNNRLKKLIELRAPDVIVRNEKRMLQEAVDALFDNGKRGRVLRGANNRPLKSLSDTLKGKQGRFRQNLLGKRVDYSGRSVIVIGPDLKLDQCGLPKRMALELFKPFIYHRLERDGQVQTIKAAKDLVEQQADIVWDILDEVIKEHPVMLNRAPTLHRLGIQAFMPVLIEGKAIKIHPLVCTAFNADFDGDQMAVHIPLSPIAQIEANVLMKSTANLLSPANGKPISVPSQDIVLGCYYLTKSKEEAGHKQISFASSEDVMLAYEMGEVNLFEPVMVKHTGDVINLELYGNSQEVEYTEIDRFENQILHTTVGRVILNDSLPEGIPFINGLLKRQGLRSLVNFCHIKYGQEMTVQILDKLKEIGFLWATKAGLSIGINDMVVPQKKADLVENARKDMLKIEKQYLEGSITNGERYNKIINLWSNVTDKVADEMFKDMLEYEKKSGEFNSIYIMADSGARGSKQQIRQLAGMRGLMAKPSGEILETPITSNFREGLTVLQYFISTHGARKGLADTALKTADSGYLTRRLVDVSQDVIITDMDCGTMKGIWAKPIVESGEIIEPLRERIIGRVALESIKDPYSGEIILEQTHEITEEFAKRIEDAGIEKVLIRSVLTCETERGVCAACYGRNLATGRMVELGEAVGVIAAQSIGEPGTQLTMRTFHIGGTASRVGQQSVLETRSNGKVKFLNLRTVRNKDGFLVVMNRNGLIAVEDTEGRERERYRLVYGAILRVNEGDEVVTNQKLVEWDPYTLAILSEVSGKVTYEDIIPSLTLAEELDEVTGLQQKVIIDSTDEKIQPLILISDDKDNEMAKYLMPSGAYLVVSEGDQVYAGDILAKIPRASAKTKDITGGLPRVVELFEARKPKEPAVITEIDGVVHIGEVKRGYRRLSVENENGLLQEYKIPRGTHINVREGERVKAGEPLIDGPINPHDILDVKGIEELQDYLVNEVQEVYRLQGVNINDKHIEVIIRQMLRWVKVEEVGDTKFIVGEKVDKFVFQKENSRVLAESGRPATGKFLLQGITKASLSTDSFFSAAAFQETTRVLTEASVEGAIDYLRGLKENVILGRLIPAGTGLPEYRNIEIEYDKEDLFDRLVETELTSAEPLKSEEIVEDSKQPEEIL